MNRHLNLTLNHTPSPLLSVSYKSPELLDELLNNLPDAVIITDANFLITGINHTAETIYGFRSDETIGKLLFSLFEFDIMGSSWGETIKELYTNGFWNGDLSYNHNGIKKLFFNTTCTLIKNDKGKATAIVFVNHNITEKILQKKDLDLAENKYETLVESLSDGVIMVNARKIIETVNKRAIEILGHTRDELQKILVSEDVWKIYNEDGSQTQTEIFPGLMTLSTGEPQNKVVMEIEHPSGRKIWISLNSRAIFKEGKHTPEAVVISFEDISEMRETHVKLKQSELLFSTFIRNSQNANWIYDEDGYIILANDIYNTITNAKGDSTGKHLLDIFPNDFGKKLVERNKQLLTGGKPIISENDLVQADGSVRTFISYLYLIPHAAPGSKRLIGGQSIDVTDIREANKKIQESNQLFRSFMSNSPNLGWVYDEEGTFLYGNPYFMERIGLTEDCIGKNIREIGKPQLAETIIQKNKAVLASKKTLITEDELIEKDGSVSYFLAYWFLIPLNNGKKLIGGHSIDITERRKMRDELMNEQILKQKQISIAALKAQEQERNRLSEELHDNVNQLLISSKLHIGAAKNAADNRNELLDRASSYILMAVDEIRKLSKSLNSKIITHIGILKSITEIVSNMSQLARINVETEIDASLIETLTTEQQIMVFRVVQEQSNNIIKYANAKSVKISLHKTRDIYKLVIIDDGKGFNTETLNIEKKDSGIGFTNINSRVNACNGHTRIISAPGKGCTLEITFPAALSH